MNLGLNTRSVTIDRNQNVIKMVTKTAMQKLARLTKWRVSLFVMARGARGSRKHKTRRARLFRAWRQRR